MIRLIRRLGQFATPFELAHEIVSYGLTLQNEKELISNQFLPQLRNLNILNQNTHTRTNCKISVLVAEGAEDKINIPVDVVILPKSANDRDFPLLIEAKSAGDFTNVNKRLQRVGWFVLILFPLKTAPNGVYGRG